MTFNIKRVLTVIEHIALIAVLAGATGFYLGNHYGSQHVSVKALTTTQNASKN